MFWPGYCLKVFFYELLLVIAINSFVQISRKLLYPVPSLERYEHFGKAYLTAQEFPNDHFSGLLVQINSCPTTGGIETLAANLNQ